MNTVPEHKLVNQNPENILPPEVMDTPEKVEQLLDQQFSDSRFADDVQQMRDPASEVHESIAEYWKSENTYAWGMGSWYKERYGLRNLHGHQWVRDLSFVDLSPRMRLFPDRAQGDAQSNTPEGIVQTVAERYEASMRIRLGLPVTRNLLDDQCRTTDELESVARVWARQRLVHQRLRSNSGREYVGIGMPLIDSLLTTARRLSSEQEVPEESGAIVARTLKAIYDESAELQPKVAGTIRNLLTNAKSLDTFSEAEEVFRLMAEYLTDVNWGIVAPSVYHTTTDADGRTIRSFTSANLEQIYDALLGDSGEQIVGKSSEREKFLDLAMSLIEDTLYTVSEGSNYAQKILQAYRKLVANPRPGVFVSPSAPQFVGLSNAVVRQGIGSLPQDQQLDLPELAPQIDKLPEALLRILYVIDPDLFDRSEDSDNGLKEELALRIDLINEMINRAQNIDGREITIGDFVLQRHLEGWSNEEIAEAINQQQSQPNEDPGSASTQYRTVAADPNVKRNTLYFKRAVRGRGIIS